MADLYDYVSPNFQRIDGDWAFPKMWKTRDQAVKCTDGTERNSPHWYRCDYRWERIGFVTFDEAHILYNAALQFRGKRALEIGCHVGYSSWHLLAGGVELAICDPVLNRVPEIRVDVRVYDTHAFMAAAWRGNVEPLDHIPDPAVVAQPGKQVIPEELRP